MAHVHYISYRLNIFLANLHTHLVNVESTKGECIVIVITSVD